MVIILKKFRFSIILFVAVLLLALCGCEDNSTPFIPRTEHDTLVIIAGQHANSRTCTDDMLDSIDFDAMVEATMTYTQEGDRYKADTHVYVINCDGTPSVVPITNKKEEVNLSASSLYSDNLMSNASNIPRRIREFLTSVELRADDPECDLAGALTLARNVLRMNPGQNNNILIIDSGITTAGYLNMVETSIQADTADVVLSTLSTAAFPDLQGYNVTFIGLGNTDGVDQENLANDGEFQRCLEAFWTNYFTICNATLTRDIIYTFDQGEPIRHNAEDFNSVPFVTSVPFTRTPAPGSTILDDGPPKYSENKLAFEPGSAEFRKDTTSGKSGEQIAINALKSNRNYYDAVLEYDPDAVFYVVGSIAKSKPDKTEEKLTTSQERADVVSGLFQTYCGIPQDRIISIGAGLTEFSWRNAVEFPDGTEESKDRNALAENRVVIIIPSIETDMVAELKANLTAAGMTEMAALVNAG